MIKLIVLLMHVVIHDHIKKAHAKLTDHVNKSSITINKVHIENNSVNNANSISKKTHKKLFKNMLKQIISVNKVHMQNNVFDYDKCKKLHKELFNNVLIELKSTNNAGHKDSSAKINGASVNDTYANNIQYKVDSANNNLLHNHMLYYFNKLKKIKKGLSELNENIKSSLNKIYHDNRVKLHEFKKFIDKLNLLLDHLCLFIFNKKAKKESIIENVNVTSNIKEYTAIIDNKRVCLGNIEEYLYETIDDIHANIINNGYEKVLADLLSIHQYKLKSINKMYIQTKNKKINNNVNKDSSKKQLTKVT